MRKAQPSERCKTCGAYVDPQDLVNGVCPQCPPRNVTLRYPDKDATKPLAPDVLRRAQERTKRDG